MAVALYPDAAEADSKEYRLKAAFLYQFAKFVTWPNDVGDTLTIGVYGQDPFGDALATIQGKTAQGKRIVVMRVSTLSELKHCCQIIFISDSEQGRLNEITKVLNRVPVLTVGETKGFPMEGGMVGFVRKGTKLKFEVNLQAARQSGLTLSSQLLKVGSVVKQ
jgi:hypothetical protein